MAPTFNADTTRYSWANAWWLATVSKLVYEDDGDVILSKLRSLGSGFRAVHTAERSSAQAALIEHDEFIVAAFRGTDEAADWLDNINAFAIDGPIGKVHRGFYQSMLDVWEPLDARIKAILAERVPEEKPSLWLTGHSLGGAMATMASARLIAEDRPFFGTYTYGQPRAGTREFARTFAVEAGDRYFRFQNNSDIVTRLPARLMGYSHVGQLVYINRHGELSNDRKWWYRFLDRVTDIDIGDGRLDSVHDHSIDDYIRAIGNWADKPIDRD